MVLVLNKKIVGLIIIFVLIFILISGFIFLRSRKLGEEVGSSYIRDPIEEKPIYRGREDSGYIAFACNVDWGNEVLPEILKILDEKNIKISFFITGRWAEKFPDLMEEIVTRGHEIGSHGYKHLDYEFLSLEQNQEQISLADEILSKYSREKITLFAPPSGSFGSNTLIAAGELGYKTILWTIDTIDWRAGSTRDIIVDRVLKKDDFNGAIVLMHPMPETAKALPLLIESMEEKGLKVGTVTNVLE